MAEKIVGILPHKTNDYALNQLATKIFTVGGIDITTDLQPTRTFDRLAPSFSQAYTLDNLPSSELLFNDIRNDGNITLNYNKNNLKYFAKYGSLLELVRVSLENIILQFPAAIHSKEEVLGRVGNNILGSGYFPLDDTMKFAVNVSYFSNPFNIYFLNNSSFQYPDDRINEIRNLTLNYFKYEVIVDGVGYPIMDFTPSAKESNDFVEIKVKGKPFDIGNVSKEFYIRPLASSISTFYKNLDDFEAYLVNPEEDFTAIFNSRKEVDGGVIVDYKIKYQFPRLDEYNLDIVSKKYEIYIDTLINFALNYDENQGNLLMRMLVPENVQSVTLEDTNSAFPTYGKINKVLIIYGRELDEINKYIENIKFFNTVTYDKKDNISDALVNSFATTLGWDVIQPDSISKEAWRLLILNSAWVWKSKGTRKAIEFILDFLGIPREIVDFNEYVIRAKKPVDVEKLEFFYSLFTDNFDMTTLPIDSEGYPVYPDDTDEDYFQINGNNDRGMAYFAKWFNLFPDTFTGSSINYSGEDISFDVVFEQDFNGTGNTLGYTVVDDSLNFNYCYSESGETIDDPYPTPILDLCGCPLPISDSALEVSIEPVDLSGCTPIILDIFYDCTSYSGGTLFINTYGGFSPVELSGATDGQDVLSGETIQVYAVDVSGCTSDLYEVYIDCVDPCLGTFIEVTLGYDCILDGFGLNTGEASVVLSATGGVPPYTYSGISDGDIVNHDEIVIVEVYDSEGCSSGLVGITVDCEPPATVVCDPIELNATLETTNVEIQNRKAKVNVTYDLIGLPTGLFVDTATLTSQGVGINASYVVGNPVTTIFTTRSGADTIQLDFTPSEVQDTITMEMDIVVLLNNGCIYENNWQLTVNPKKLGNATFYDAILTQTP